MCIYILIITKLYIYTVTTFKYTYVYFTNWYYRLPPGRFSVARLATWRFGLWRIYWRFLEDWWRIYGRFTDDLWTIYGGFIEEIGGLWKSHHAMPCWTVFFLSAKWKACVTGCNGAPKRPLHQTIEPSRRMHSHVPQLTSRVKNSKQQNPKKT